jgi:predicted unusual protein kinase regulating ubiquinone biosynthesis (AarF/ABC1/UbiB family)
VSAERPQQPLAGLDALLRVAARIARSAPSGRLLLARLHELLEPEWIPQPWREDVTQELADAHAASLQALAPAQVEAALGAAWEERPDRILDELDVEPFAVSPGAQVHRAVLDGRSVAVKLLRPGLAGAVRQDLALLEGLVAPLGATFPAIDPGALVREFRERVLDELDLEHEAGSMRRFQRALRSDPQLRIPAPVTSLSHDEVLVSELIEGRALGEASEAERDRACALLVRFVAGGLVSGIVHADPNPRDLLVLDDGRLAILDFGAMAVPQGDRVEALRAAVEAFAERDPHAFTAALAQLGALPAEDAPAALELLTEVLGEFAGAAPVRLDIDAVVRMRERARAVPPRLAELITRGSIAPADLWPARALLQMFATIARVGATGPWRELLREALREGWG